MNFGHTSIPHSFILKWILINFRCHFLLSYWSTRTKRLKILLFQYASLRLREWTSWITLHIEAWALWPCCFHKLLLIWVTWLINLNKHSRILDLRVWLIKSWMISPVFWIECLIKWRLLRLRLLGWININPFNLSHKLITLQILRNIKLNFLQLGNLIVFLHHLFDILFVFVIFQTAKILLPQSVYLVHAHVSSIVFINQFHVFDCVISGLPLLMH